MSLTRLLYFVAEYIDEYTEPGFIAEVSTYTTIQGELKLVLCARVGGTRFTITRGILPTVFSAHYGPAGEMLGLLLRDMITDLQQAVKAAEK